jgi:hypothetical protein
MIASGKICMIAINSCIQLFDVLSVLVGLLINLEKRKVDHHPDYLAACDPARL